MAAQHTTISRFTFVALFFALFFIILPNIAHAEPSIQELVAGVDEKALHAALHETSDGKYKHGVFQGDTNALEAVHKSNPIEAKRIIQLARRQSNGTIPGSNTVIQVTTHIASIHTETTIASAFTVTGANGERSTYTSLILVQATDSADQAGGGSGTVNTPSITSGKPSLQTNAGDKLAVDLIQKLTLVVMFLGGLFLL